MALKVELKPNEKIIVGSCVITNTDQRAKFLIEGDKLPVLREKDILTPDTAETPSKLIYLAVQIGHLASSEAQRARDRQVLAFAIRDEYGRRCESEDRRGSQGLRSCRSHRDPVQSGSTMARPLPVVHRS